MAINLKMPRISHPINCLDHQSNLLSNWEASPVIGPSSHFIGDLLATIDLSGDQRIKRDFFFRQIEELR